MEARDWGFCFFGRRAPLGRRQQAIRSVIASRLRGRSIRRRVPPTPAPELPNRRIHILAASPSKATGTTIALSLDAAIDRGLKYNLGLIETNQASADVRAQRMRALSALLPQIEARGRQGYEDISFHEIGLKLPAIPG